MNGLTPSLLANIASYLVKPDRDRDDVKGFIQILSGLRSIAALNATSKTWHDVFHGYHVEAKIAEAEAGTRADSPAVAAGSGGSGSASMLHVEEAPTETSKIIYVPNEGAKFYNAAKAQAESRKHIVGRINTHV